MADDTSGSTKRQIVVLSDIHIATDGPTAWYQSSIHNKYLREICDWIVANAATIREVVLLGDVVDFWTHPCDVQPPSFADIVKAQPDIFGPTGYFADVLDALGGAVTLVPGNHDMGVSAADAASVVSANGNALKFANSVYYPLGGSDQRIALAHGNAYTMFNAEDPTTSWAPLPVGHFVTRMIASQWARNLPAGGNVATLPGQGSPNGLDVGAIIKGAVTSGSFGITKLLLDSVAAQTGTPASQTFILPGGQTVALDTDVRPAYDNLFSNWAAASGGGATGAMIAAKSALADGAAYYMGWFAQRLALQSGSQVVVFGHTHTPISGLATNLVQYANSGFACPSTADMPAQTISFVVIDSAGFTTQVMQSTGSGVTPLAAPLAAVVEKGADFSCYVIIDNTGGDDMTLSGSQIPHGYWVVPPPATIAAGTRAIFWAQDYPGPMGSEGAASYQSTSRGQLDFAFRCPTALPNSATGGSSLITKSGSDPWGNPGDVKSGGHPFYVNFTA